MHQSRGVDELILLDIDATKEGRGPDLALIQDLADTCYMPLTVGGGVKSVEGVRDLLRCGADKVSIKSALIEDAGLCVLEEISHVFGAQAVVASIDVDGAHKVWIDGERVGAEEWALECQKAGAGEILLTSIPAEGTMEGYDLDLIESVTRTVEVPVIAHGGCGSYEDMYLAIQAGASAVAVGALFQFTDCTPKEAARYLTSRGVEARETG